MEASSAGGNPAGRIGGHWPPGVFGIGDLTRATDFGRECEAAKVEIITGKDLGQSGHVFARVRLDWIAVYQPVCPVRVQFEEPDSEQLHHLARIILVGHAACARIGSSVAAGV